MGFVFLLAVVVIFLIVGMFLPDPKAKQPQQS